MKAKSVFIALLLFTLLFSGCQHPEKNSNKTVTDEPDSISQTETNTPDISIKSQTSSPYSSTEEVPFFDYNPLFIPFDSLETMGIAMKGYGLNDVVKNDPRFTEEEKSIIENIQKNKGHNDFFYDIPIFTDKSFKLHEEVRLIHSSDIKAGVGVKKDWHGFGVGFTVTAGNNDYNLDMYGDIYLLERDEYIASIDGRVLSDTPESVIIVLGTNGSATVYDVYFDKRMYHCRITSNAPSEDIVSLVHALKSDWYFYDDLSE